MRITILLKFSALCLFLSFQSTLFAQGIEFMHSWEEAQVKSKEEGKIIFVDAYAVWCGPCKRLAKKIFPKKEVGDFFNQHFINLKLDMEKGEGLIFRKKYPVSAYPTLFFISPDGKVVHKIKGAPRTAKALTNQAQLAVNKFDPSGDMNAQYENGERSPEFMIKYIRALKKGQREYGKIANDFINEQEDLNTPDNLQFIAEAVYTVDSRIYEMFIDKKDQMLGLLGKDKVDIIISNACQRTTKKANIYDAVELLEQAQDEMKKHVPAMSKVFKYNSEMGFALAQNDPKRYLKSVKVYAKDKVWGNLKMQHALANKIYNSFPSDMNCMKYAAKLVKNPAKMGGDYAYNLTYARILAAMNKKDKARIEAEKAVELARENARYTQVIEQFIKTLD